MTHMKSFRDLVKGELARRGVSQEDMADAIGISGAQVTRILNGTRGRTPDKVRKIGLFLGIPEEDIFRAAEITSTAPDPNISPAQKMLVNETKTWSEDEIEELLAMARAKTEHRETYLMRSPHVRGHGAIALGGWKNMKWFYFVTFLQLFRCCVSDKF